MRGAAAHPGQSERGYARDVRLLVQAAVLAYGVGLVVHALHGDQHALHGANPVLHWLRDSTFALPTALVAVAVGARVRAGRTTARDALAAALTTAATFSVLAVPGTVVHRWLFVAEHGAVHAEHAAGTGIGQPFADAAVMLGPGVLVALAGAALSARLARPRPARPRRGAVPGRGVVVRRRLAASTAVALLGTLVPAGVMPASAATNAPTPSAAVAERCTAANAARVYDVRAIQVEIPYNRWGQTDPNGLMYALGQDVKAIENWYRPLAADPADDPAKNRRLRPRPLVLRANEGECVKVTLTNELPSAVMADVVKDPRVSLHVHGATYDVASSDGSAVGYNADTTVGRGDSITYLWRAPKQEGVYEFHDHGMPAGSQADGGSLSHGLFGALAVEPAGSVWTDPRSGLPLYPPSKVADQSGDLYIDADITPRSGKAFRESVQLSQDEVPGIGFAFNYGSEPASNREANRCPDCVGEETSLSSWTYGDPGLVKLASGGLPVPAPTSEDEDAVRPVGWRPTPGVDDEEDCQSDTGTGKPRMSMPVVNGTRVPASCWTASIMQTYQHDPTKIRFGHVGPKETHVFHLHAHQWLAEPKDTGKSGATPGSPSDTRRPESTTVDSQTYGPGDMFTADLLFGAGSKPGTAGDSIFHCHLYPHFAEGFWALLRVHDVLEDGRGTTPDGVRVRTLLPLPDRSSPPSPTADNPGFPRFIPGTVGWRAPQPPAGTVVGPDGQPAPRVVAGQLLDPASMATTQTVTRPAGADARFTLTYRGETTTALPATAPARGPGSVEAALEALPLIEDVAVEATSDGWRIVFAEPARNVTALTAAAVGGGAAPTVTVATTNLAERLAVERRVLLRAHGGKEPKPGAPMVDPCPQTVTDPRTGAKRPTRTITYDAAVIQTDIVYNEAGWHDTQGRVIVPLADVDAILAGTKKPEPLFIRVNAGDCVNYNLTNMLPNWFGNDAFVKLAQTNMVAGHIHLVKFDVLGSDGSSNGWNYQQAAYSQAQHEYLQGVAANQAPCSTDESAGACRLSLPADYDPRTTGKFPGQTIKARWFADYELRTVFTHDHHFPALDQNRGLYGALVVEPAGMDIRNPVTGVYSQPINDPAHGPVCGTACTGTASGTIVDVIGPGAKDDFREFGVTIQDFVSLTKKGGNPQSRSDTLNPPESAELFPDEDPGVMAINYRNAPLVLRQTYKGKRVDPAYQFSSRIFGDPATPLLQAYAGDPVRMRVVQGSQEEQHVLALHGMRWRDEPDDPQSPLVASKALGISDAFNFEIPEMSCGADDDCRGDYLYSGAATDDTWLGAWGLMRVFGRGVHGLLPLPDRKVQAANGNTVLKPSGTAPPKANKPGTPCPGSAPVRSFQVVATDARIEYNRAGDHDPYGLLYTAVRPGETVADAVARAKRSPEPMALHANEGDCLEVTLLNQIDPTGPFATVHAPKGSADGDPRLPLESSKGTPAGLRVSLHPQLLKYDVRGSDGATIGFNRDQTVGPGESILYRWWADDVTPGELGAINLLDFGDVRGHRHHGLFAGLTIHPAGSTHHDPITGAAVVDGQSADVRIPGRADYRNFTTFFQDGLNLRDAAGRIIHDPVDQGDGADGDALDAEDSGEKGFNYRNEPFHHRLGARVVDADDDDPVDGDDLARVFSSADHGDPATPIFRAYTGDAVRVRVLQGADKPRQNAYGLSGHSWLAQPDDPGSTQVGAAGGISVGRALNVHVAAAGGDGQVRGDFRYGSTLGFHHQSGGLWGITRVYPAPLVGAVFLPDALGAGGPDNPFREGYHPLQPLERSQVVARVFDDVDLDGRRGKEEVAVPGTTVTLRAAGGATHTEVADAQGVAAFDVGAGTYDVSTSVPDGWKATTPTGATVTVAGDNGFGEAVFGVVRPVETTTGTTDTSGTTTDPAADTTPPAAPTAAVATASDGHTKVVTLSGEAGATIRYTLDGSAPAAGVGMTYAEPVTVSSTRTLTAVAVDAAGNVSPALSAPYVVDRGAGVALASVTPDRWTVSTGGAPRGSVTSMSENLAADDGSKRWFLPAALSDKSYRVSGYATAVLPAAQRGVVSLGVGYDGGADVAGASRTLHLYDFVAARWRSVHSTEVQSVEDMRVTWDAGNPKRFVSRTGEVRVRVTASSKATFELGVDELTLLVGHTR